MVAENFSFLSFEEGTERIQKALKQVGATYQSRQIITSRDDAIGKAVELLAINNVGEGFKKWQLPAIFDPDKKKGAQFYVTAAEPGQKVAKHAHDEGDGIRFIAGGSVIFNGQELVQGDWMFIPEGAEYELEIGKLGALMCYCYQCCCVPR